MAVSPKDVKRLRDETGAGMMDCKSALEDAGGDVARAKDLLRERGIAKAQKLSERSAEEGAIFAYLHQPDLDLPPKVGAMIELNCATDFVAKTEGFQKLAREIATHISWARPTVVSRDQLPEDMVQKERDLIAAQAKAEGKPDNVIDKIVEGRMKTFYQEHCLLDQLVGPEEDRSVAQLLDEASAELKEPIKVRRFARFRVGAE